MDEFLAKYPKLKRFTPFQQRVYFETSKIPAGQVASYQEIAAMCGRPRAFRAVGNALNVNPYIGDIPCHRVIKSNGHIGGFGEELDLKYQLLASEGVLFDREGFRLRKPS